MMKKLIFTFFVLSSYYAQAGVYYASYAGDTDFYVMDDKNKYMEESLKDNSLEPSQRVYVEAKIGYKGRDFEPAIGGQSQKKKDELMELSGALGVQVKTMLGNVRTELEGSYNSHGKRDAVFKLDDGTRVRASNIKMNTYFLNAYYDLFPSYTFSPYIGGGIGVSQSRIRVQSDKGTNHYNHETWKYKMAWNVAAGVTTHLGRDLDLDVGYRYMDPGRISLTDKVSKTPISVENKSQTVLVGLRYLF